MEMEGMMAESRVEMACLSLVLQDYRVDMEMETARTS
jgi:hypothetical protein